MLKTDYYPTVTHLCDMDTNEFSAISKFLKSTKCWCDMDTNEFSATIMCKQLTKSLQNSLQNDNVFIFVYFLIKNNLCKYKLNTELSVVHNSVFSVNNLKFNI